MRIKIFTLLLIFIGLNIFWTAPLAAQPSNDIPVGSTAAPSSSVLGSNLSGASSATVSPLAATERSLSTKGAGMWGDEAVYSEDGAVLVVGMPIGDVSLPIVLSLMMFYMGFKLIQSKRKSVLAKEKQLI